MANKATKTATEAVKTRTIRNAKTVAKESTLEAKFLELLEGASLDDVKVVQKTLTDFRQNHDDYIAPIVKPHLIKKNEAIKKILNQILGLNAAYNKIDELIKDKTLVLSEYTTFVIKDEQLKFLFPSKNGLSRVKHFMSSTQAVQKSFTPKEILNVVIKVATMKPENYAKRVATFGTSK